LFADAANNPVVGDASSGRRRSALGKRAVPAARLSDRSPFRKRSEICVADGTATHGVFLRSITGLAQRLHGERDHPRWYDRLASCGYARSGVLVRVVDDRDHDLPPGEIGEVITKSDCVMDGYWQNPAANAEMLRGGWLHTGDLGSMDADGLLTLRDRSKDMIISGGSNIYPREIEEVLLRHPDVVEASVVGRPHPDWGEEVVAFLVARLGMAVAAAELDRLCLDHIARFKRPRDYRFVEALPKNNYGKVLKTELRRLLQKGP
jgi:long-chain acyl-CoA synthetase